MYKGRRVKKTARNHERTGRNLLLILAAVLLVGTVTVGTVAYFTDQAVSTNTGIKVGQVACSVTEPEDSENGTYTITNTGTVDAYIRVAVVANWVAEDGTVYWTAPTRSVESNDFSEKDDGFWYSDSIVPANSGDKSEVTLSVTASGTAPTGYKLDIQVIAEAIQGQAAAANAAWGTSY